MSKGIVVLDIPETCENCITGFANYDLKCFLCYLKPGYRVRFEQKKPDWCPIRTLPDKLESDSRNAHEDFDYVCGWNDCLDELLKDGG